MCCRWDPNELDPWSTVAQARKGLSTIRLEPIKISAYSASRSKCKQAGNSRGQDLGVPRALTFQDCFDSAMTAP